MTDIRLARYAGKSSGLVADATRNGLLRPLRQINQHALTAQQTMKIN